MLFPDFRLLISQFTEIFFYAVFYFMFADFNFIIDISISSKFEVLIWNLSPTDPARFS